MNASVLIVMVLAMNPREVLDWVDVDTIGCSPGVSVYWVVRSSSWGLVGVLDGLVLSEFKWLGCCPVGYE
jgi:hypothetical protein